MGLLINPIQSAPISTQEDLSNLIQFHDSRKLSKDPKPGDIWSLFTSKPWTEEEKNLILTSLLLIKDKSPGLFQRATVYRPIRLYRATRLGREDVPAMTLREQQAFLIGDPFFLFKGSSNFKGGSNGTPSQQTLFLTHELVHLSDQFGAILEKKEWLDLVEPGIARVKKNLEKIKPGLTVHQAQMEGGYRDIAIKEGFPSLWASLSPAEALAEYTVALLFKKDYKVPEKLRAFIHANILATPFIPDPAMKAFHQGLKELEDDRLLDALASFNKGIQFNSKFGDLYQHRAKIWAKKNELEKAINDYSEAIRLTPGSEKFFERGLLYTQKKETDKAIADYTEYIRLVPWLEKGYQQRVMEWLRKGDLDKAIADVSDILRLNSKLTHYYGFRGDLWAAKKDPDRAITDYSELIKNSPSKDSNAATAYYKRGTVYMEKKEIDKAISDFTEYIAINPLVPKGFEKRGQAWHAKKEWRKAILDLSEAIKLQFDNMLSHVYRADSYMQLLEYDNAISDLNTILLSHPNNYFVLFSRGLAWDSKKEYEKAITDLSSAIEKKHDYKEAYQYRGRAWLRKKEWDKALLDFNQAIAIDTKDSFSYLLRGNAWDGKKEITKAVADFQEAIKINSRYAAAYNKLASILATYPDAKIRDGRKAIEYATQACELTSWKESFYLETLASAYAEAGEFENAVKWQIKVLEMSTSDLDKKTSLSRLELYKAKKPFHKEE